MSQVCNTMQGMYMMRIHDAHAYVMQGIGQPCNQYSQLKLTDPKFVLTARELSLIGFLASTEKLMHDIHCMNTPEKYLFVKNLAKWCLT